MRYNVFIYAEDGYYCVGYNVGVERLEWITEVEYRAKECIVVPFDIEQVTAEGLDLGTSVSIRLTGND